MASQEALNQHFHYFMVSSLVHFCIIARSWSLKSWNAGGFFARLKDDQLRADLSQSDVILVQETQSTKTPTLPTHDVWAIPATPVPPGQRGRPTGGLAIFIKKTLPYSWEQVATDNAHYQVAILRFASEEVVLANVYIPPACTDAFDLFLTPLANELKRLEHISSHIVAGDFNARIGDVHGLDPEDEFITLVPQLNLDRTLNDNRAGFLSFLEATDLRLLNGRDSTVQGQPIPASFTFTSIRSSSSPGPSISCTIARSCIDYIVASPALLPLLSPLQLTAYHHSEHSTLSTVIPYLNDLHPPTPVAPLLKFYPPDIEIVLAIFREFDLASIPPDAHPLTYLIDQIHSQGKWKPRPTPKSWFETPATVAHSATVAKLRTAARKHYRAIVDRGDVSSFPDFLAARSAWIKAVDEGRQLATSSFQTRLASWKKSSHLPGHASKLWKVMSGKKSEFGTSIPESQLVDHFNSLLFKNQPLAFKPPDPPVLDPHLDTPFTEAEVLKAIRSKSPSSAPGADQLQYSFWKEVSDDPESLTNLTQLFNHIFSTGIVPQDWHTAVVTMLYKGKGPRNLATNFRAISLTATSLKIFETLLASRLSSWSERNKILSYHQAGFRSHRSTYDHIFTLASLQQAAGKKDLFVGFVDLAKAFPSVSRQKLLNKLGQLGVSTKMLNVVADMYSPDSYRFILSNSTIGTQAGQADTGTREGSCLSPLLFLLFVHDLPAFLDECGSLGPKIRGKVLRVLQFADDTTLLALDRKNFQVLLDRFALYCQLNDLTINASKTEIINLRENSRASRKDHWTLNSVPLRVSSSARYLGVIFSTGRLGVHHAQHLRTRNLAKVWSLVGRIRRAGFTDFDFIFRLFRVLIVSSATYGAGLLFPFPKHRLSQKIDCLLTNFLRSIWSLPRGTPNHLVLSIANSPCMTCLCMEDAIRFLTRKLLNWGINSQLVEDLLSDMFEDKSSLESLLSPSWLGYLLQFLSRDLNLLPTPSSIPELRASLLAIDPKFLHGAITTRCHSFCYPPSPSREPSYRLLNVSAAGSWPCFSSSAPHYRFCRLLLSGSFRHSRELLNNGVEKICPQCNEVLSIQHWFDCPNRLSDHQLLASETGFVVNSFEKLREVVTNPRYCVALEFVLSRFFKATS